MPSGCSGCLTDEPGRHWIGHPGRRPTRMPTHHNHAPPSSHRDPPQPVHPTLYPTGSNLKGSAPLPPPRSTPPRSTPPPPPSATALPHLTPINPAAISTAHRPGCTRRPAPSRSAPACTPARPPRDQLRRQSSPPPINHTSINPRSPPRRPAPHRPAPSRCTVARVRCATNAVTAAEGRK